MSEFFKKKGCILLETKYIHSKWKLKYICVCGNTSRIRFSHFKDGCRCMKCCIYQKFTFEFVFNFFQEQGCVLLSTTYKNTKSKLKYICVCGNTSNIIFNNFKQGERCKRCGYEKTAKKSFRFKDYIFPSGKVIRIQGYENYILDELLKTYSEQQILTSRKDMPKIEYYYEQKRRYYPDIFIPHLNKIIEVKSNWSLHLDYARNMLKRDAARKNYDYDIWIYDEKTKQITIF